MTPLALLAVAVAVVSAAGRAAAAPAAGIQLDIANEKQFDISPLLYSAFLETEINFGGEGGLYAELLPNRDLETLGRGTIPGTPSDAEDNVAGGPAPPPDPSDFRPWTAIDDTDVQTDQDDHPFKSNPTSLRITVTPEQKHGAVRNPGYWGIGLREGVNYNFTFYAKSDGMASVRGQLVDPASGKVLATSPDVAPSCGVVWCRYTTLIQNNQTGSAVVEFQLVTEPEPNSGGVLWLDHISLVPTDAVAGLFRKDIFELLKGLNAGFLRTPGGNYLEGYTLDTRWNWKNTIGPAEQRAGHYNSAWGYWVTDGLGIYELLVLAELLETVTQMSVFTGYSMGKPYVPLNQSQQFAQDAVDMIDFAKGDTSTKYGQVRASMGHAAPFEFTRMEVGNEEALMNTPDYPAHYRLITGEIWKKDPKMQVCASGRWNGEDISNSPCLTGARCDMWDDHYYRNADTMAAMTTQYDNYNRSWPDVFVGEYAANGDRKPNLRAGLAEAAFLLGFEHNADKVKASSFAPLLTHIDSSATQWDYDLLVFNATNIFALPSYDVQCMLNNASHGYTVPLNVTGKGGQVFRAVASVDPDAHVLYIKAVNYDGNALPLTANLNGFKVQGSSASVQVLTSSAGPDAENSLDQPHFVAPTTSSVAISKLGSGLTLAPWSLTIVQVPLAH